MVEPVSITLGALAATLIARSAEKATDRVANDAVEAGAGAAGALVRWLRGKLGSSEQLDLVEAAPDSRQAAIALGDAIDAEIVEDDDLRELTAYVNVLHAQQTSHQSAIGKHIYQADRASTITATHGGPPPPANDT